MPNVDFTIAADVAPLLRAHQQEQAAQDKTEKGFREMAAAGDRAGDTLVASMRKTAEAYELAETDRAKFTRGLTETASAAESANRRIVASHERVIATTRQAIGLQDELARAVVRTEAAAGRASRPRTFGVAPLAPSSSGLGSNLVIPAAAGGGTYALASDVAAARNLAGMQALIARGSAISAGAQARAAQQAVDAEDRRQLQSQIDQNNFANKAQRLRQNAFFTGTGRLGRLPLGAQAGLYAGAFKGYMAAGAAWGSNFARAGEVADANIAFQEELTGLVGLDGNLDRLGQVKSGVLADAIGRGMSRADVVDARFNFEQATSDLPADERSQIWQQGMLLTKTRGGSLSQNLMAITKLWQNFGGGFRDVRQATNFLAFTEAKGNINMQELAETAPDVFPAFKEAGFGTEDFAATVQVLTTNLGSNDATMRQIRNLPARLLKTEKALGVRLKGTFEERLTQLNDILSKLSPDDRLMKLKKVFEDEGLVAGSTLLSNLGAFSAARASFGSVPDDYLFQMSLKRMADPAYRSAEALKGLRSLRENIPAMAAQEGVAGRNRVLYEASLAGLEYENRDKPWVTRESIEKMAQAKSVAGAIMGGAISKESRIGLQLQYKAMLDSAAGITDRGERRKALHEAETFRAEYGEAFAGEQAQFTLLGMEFGKVATSQGTDFDGSAFDAADAEELRRLAADRGIFLSTGELAEFHRIAAADPAAGESYLQQKKTAADATVISGPMGAAIVRPGAGVEPPRASALEFLNDNAVFRGVQRLRGGGLPTGSDGLETERLQVWANKGSFGPLDELDIEADAIFRAAAKEKRDLTPAEATRVAEIGRKRQAIGGAGRIESMRQEALRDDGTVSAVERKRIEVAEKEQELLAKEGNHLSKESVQLLSGMYAELRKLSESDAQERGQRARAAAEAAKAGELSAELGGRAARALKGDGVDPYLPAMKPNQAVANVLRTTAGLKTYGAVQEFKALFMEDGKLSPEERAKLKYQDLKARGADPAVLRAMRGEGEMMSRADAEGRPLTEEEGDRIRWERYRAKRLTEGNKRIDPWEQKVLDKMRGGRWSKDADSVWGETDAGRVLSNRYQKAVADSVSPGSDGGTTQTAKELQGLDAIRKRIDDYNSAMAQAGAVLTEAGNELRNAAGDIRAAVQGRNAPARSARMGRNRD